MVESITVLLVLTAFSSSYASPMRDDDLAAAIAEMRSANYFSFVMLLKMSPPNLIQGNVTFLLPDDKMLSNSMLPSHEISDFLLRHTIPSPLLFDYLQHIPTGSMLPTSEPEYMVRVDNQGRRSFSLNNVRITNPNVCVTGSSIRCHGIDAVLPASNVPGNPTISPWTTCLNATTGVGKPGDPQLPSPPSLAIPAFPRNPPTSPSNRQQGSGSPPLLLSHGILRPLLTCTSTALWFVGFFKL